MDPMRCYNRFSRILSYRALPFGLPIKTFQRTMSFFCWKCWTFIKKKKKTTEGTFLEVYCSSNVHLIFWARKLFFLYLKSGCLRPASSIAVLTETRVRREKGGDKKGKRERQKEGKKEREEKRAPTVRLGCSSSVKLKNSFFVFYFVRARLKQFEIRGPWVY